MSKNKERTDFLLDEEKPTVYEAYLQLPAFMAIVSSAVESFRKETIGYLIGLKSDHKFRVEYAIPYLTAESGFAHATLDLKRTQRINDILKKFSEGLEYIGDYHSHTLFGDNTATVKPSSSDLGTTSAGELNLICAINLKQRSVAWRENRHGSLVGSVGEYHIEIGGYYVDKPRFSLTYQRVRIKCPAITGVKESA
jgi:hypothetical protein